MVAVLLLKWNEFVKLNVGIPDGLLMNHFMLALQRAHDSIGLGAVEDRQYAVEESAQASAMPFEGFVHSLKLDDISAENREALGHFDALLAATTGLDCTDFADKDKKPDTSETALESAAAKVVDGSEYLALLDGPDNSELQYTDQVEMSDFFRSDHGMRLSSSSLRQNYGSYTSSSDMPGRSWLFSDEESFSSSFQRSTPAASSNTNERFDRKTWMQPPEAPTLNLPQGKPKSKRCTSKSAQKSAPNSQAIPFKDL